MAYSLRYADRVRKVLISRADRGIKQYELHQKTRTPKYKSKDLTDLLENWRRAGWVDKFVIRPESTRPITHWRATALLLEQWAELSSELLGTKGD